MMIFLAGWPGARCFPTMHKPSYHCLCDPYRCDPQMGGYIWRTDG